MTDLEQAAAEAPAARPRAALALLQPGALLAGLQRPRAPARRGPERPAARAAEVRRDLLEQPRRVLHGARGRDARVRRRRHRPPARGRPHARRDRRGDRRRASASSWRASPPASTTTCARRSPSTGSASSTATRSTRSTAPSSTSASAARSSPSSRRWPSGSGRPFPYISNLSLSLAVLVRDPETEQETFARVKVPKEMLPRFVPIGDGRTFVPLEDLIAQHLDALFPGMEIVDYDVFRVTRDADFEVDDEADDLLRAVEQELRRRRFGEVVRLEVGAGMSEALREPLLARARARRRRRLRGRRAARPQGPVGRRAASPASTSCATRRGRPVTHPRLQPAEDEPADVMAAMRRGDILVHHPYDSFSTSVERLGRAGRGRPGRARDQADRVPHERRLAAGPGADPRGRARQAGGLPRGAQGALRRARQHRLGARARAGGRPRRLRPARAQDAREVHPHRPPRGRRRPPLRARRHGQLPPDARRGSTPTSGCSPATTRSAPTSPTCSTSSPGFARPAGSRKVLLAPAHMRDGIIDEIERTIAAKEAGEDARIAMKMNSLVDKRCIRALYRASQAGVPVELNIRGICCLRPGVDGRLGEHPGRLDRRPLPRALPHLRVPARRRGDDLHRLGRPHAAQPRHPRRAARAGARARRCRAELDRHAGALHGRRHERLGARGGRRLGRAARRASPPRNAQNELMARHAARAVDAAAGAA